MFISMHICRIDPIVLWIGKNLLNLICCNQYLFIPIDVCVKEEFIYAATLLFSAIIPLV